MSRFKMKSFNPAGKDFKVDPVCGMKVDSLNPPFQAHYQNKNYKFCSEICRYLFERDPEKYIHQSQE